MKTLPPILNRDFKLPDDGKVHLVPKGNYPVMHQDKRIVQVVDDAALAAMTASLQADAATPDFGGLCIDFDHFRHDHDKESRAGGWLDGSVENRDKGLFGTPRWSASGRAAVEGGDYRFISPEFDPLTLQHIGGDKYRPTRLVGFGLTNNPNMRGMTPLSNRRVGASDGEPTTEADKQNQHTMKIVTGLLGLADGANEDQIAAAIRGIQTEAGKVPVLTNRVQTLTDERVLLVGESIDADLAAHGITDAATIAKLKPVLLGPTLKNREERVDFIALFPKPAANAPVVKKSLTNRADARTPESVVTADENEQSKESVERDHAIVNRARGLRASNPKLSQPVAYQMARSQVESEAAAKK